MFADVALAVKTHRTFTYRVPEGMTAPVGARVVVPFGAKVLVGFVVALMEEPPPYLEESAIKPILAVLDETPLLTPDLLELTRWVAEYYFAPWGKSFGRPYRQDSPQPSRKSSRSPNAGVRL